MAVNFEEEAALRDASNVALMTAIDEGTGAESHSDWDFEVVNDAEHGRWEAILNEDAIGELTYRFVGGRVVLLSTWVSETYRRQGVARGLIANALNEVRESRRKITIICPVIGDFIARNRQYLDLIDPVHSGEGASAASGPQKGDWEEQPTTFERDLG
jgi:predicted GNAT family acetyltransferase